MIKKKVKIHEIECTKLRKAMKGKAGSIDKPLAKLTRGKKREGTNCQYQISQVPSL